MIARSAFTQPRQSALLLAGTVAGMSAVFIAPPMLSVLGGRMAVSLALLSWFLMTAAFLPTLRPYGLNPAWALSLPVSSLIYLGAALDAARRHWARRGGTWKGRRADPALRRSSPFSSRHAAERASPCRSGAKSRMD